MTLAETYLHAFEVGIEHMRDTLILAFGAMTDGLADQKRAEARKGIRFMENETNAQTWERMRTMIDPETGVSLADEWLADWERWTAQLGPRKEAEPKRTEVAQAYR